MMKCVSRLGEGLAVSLYVNLWSVTEASVCLKGVMSMLF